MRARLVHISDTHFGTEIPHVCDAVHRAITDLKPDMIVLSGDITQRARVGQFTAARRFIESLPAPVLAVPGNHDIPLYNIFRRFLDPYGRYCEAFGDREWLWQGCDIAMIGFDATHPRRHTRGALDPARTKAALSAARATIGADQPLLAVVHQPLVVAWVEDTPERLINAEAIAEIFAQYRVGAVLSGHVHVPLVCSLEQHFPGIQNLPLHCGAGTAISHRTRPGAPNSFNLISIEKNGTVAADIFVYQQETSRFILHPASE